MKRTRSFLRRNATLNTTGDDWELDPSHLYMNNKLGEGNFGEVYKATLSSDLSSPRAKKYAETVSLLTKAKSPCFVAIKVLKSEYFLLTVFMVLPLNCEYFLSTVGTSCIHSLCLTCVHLVFPANCVHGASFKLLVFPVYHWYFCIHSLCSTYIQYFLLTFGTSCLLSIFPACCWYFLLVIAPVKCLW